MSSSKSKGLRKTLHARDNRIGHGNGRDDGDGTPKHLCALLDD